MRARAIACALFYGLAPWRLYERACHYSPMSYRAHLAMNLGYAWIWLTGRESAEDRAFELEVNARSSWNG
jgi:hypothetical protein